MARTVYVTTEITGGGSGLDGIDGSNIVKGDMAFLINPDSTTIGYRQGNYFGVYVATTKNASDDSPEIVNPDANPGDWNWEKMTPLIPVFHTTGKAATLPNYGVSIIRTTAPSVHVLKRPRRGAYKKLIFATTQVIKVRLTTAVAGSLAVPTVRFGGVGLIAGSSVCVIVAPTSKCLLGTVKMPTAIELIGRSTSRWEIMEMSVITTGGIKKFPTLSSTT
jgi:hypothetical protein